MNLPAKCIQEFQAVFGDRFEQSDISKAIYSTDASIYQWQPLGICFPKSEAEIIATVQIARTFKLPILCRGGGTSLAGQAVNQAIILDFTKYYNRILSYSAENATIKVQPGLIHESLNNYTSQDRLQFAPDPATSNRATIGGMIANNSSGTRSIRYGKTQDHIVSLRVLLSDGTILECSECNADVWAEKALDNTTEGIIYKAFREIIYAHTPAIEQAFPKIMRRVSGYNLDAFVHRKNWNLSDLFCGSEGSLGIILEATLKLEPLPSHQIIYMVHFGDRISAIQHVEPIVSYFPSAVEMLDYNVLEESRMNQECIEHLEACVLGTPKAILLVEFSEMSESSLAERQKNFEKYLANQGLKHIFLRAKTAMNHAWDLRKKGLGLIMARASKNKPIPFIEDCSIPLKHLADYVSFILNYCTKMGVETVLYAHASVGVLHIRPMLDLRTKEDIEKMKIIGSEALKKVMEYGGSWSGEHGDGRIRSVKLKAYFGNEVYACLKETKQLLDPFGIMNPGIIVDPIPEDRHLRYGPEYIEQQESLLFNYRKEQSFQDIVHNCSGVGACRKTQSGTMCPSYMVTMDETHSTRGRANVLRLVMSGQLGSDGLSSSEAAEVMSLCVSCKACKTECPSRVDMGKLKSEVFQKKYDVHGKSLREKAVEASMDMAKLLSGRTSRFINPIMRHVISRKALALIGFNPKRKLPAYSSENIVRWDSRRLKKVGSPVYLFADSYLKYHHTGLAKKIVGFLESYGFAVELVDLGCCQRPRISNGFLRKAKEQANILANKILGFDIKIPFIVSEPSCYSALLEDLPDLMNDNEYEIYKQFTFQSLEDFVAAQMDAGRIQLDKIETNAVLHAHCHHKSINGTKSISKIMQTLFGAHWHELDAGCCGMAGAFGYEKEHDEISRAMALRKLIPSIQNSTDGTAVVANGFSCIHQIKDLSGRKAVHWIDLIYPS